MRFPQPRTRFAGREEDLERLSALCDTGPAVVTLWGPPGIGKTRLAVELCRRSALARGGKRIHKSWFCDLTPARSASDIDEIVAHSLGAEHERATAALATIAARDGAVIVLDNFDQVVRYASETVGLWAEQIPELWFVVTSRERLRLTCEGTHEVLPLAPSAAASELFLDRVGLLSPTEAAKLDLQRVTELMRRLEGIPLAIELAAARFDVLGLDGLLSRLVRPLDLLDYGARDAGAKHRTLRNAIEASFQLLSPRDQRVLAQCAVFRGSFSLDAAEAVLESEDRAALDVLQSLRDKSLVRRSIEDDGSVRFCLYDAVRAFVDHLLNDETRARHAGFYLRASGCSESDQSNLIEAVSFALRQETSLDETVAALARIDPGVASDAIVDLLGRAMAARAHALAPDLAAIGYRARGRALLLRGRIAEARHELEHARDLVGLDAQLMGYISADLGVLHHQMRELDTARTYYETALAIHSAHDDRASEARCLGNLGALHHDAGRHDEALDHYRRALDAFSVLGDRRLEGIFSANLAVLLQERGDYREARHLYTNALELLVAIGDRRLEAITRSNLGLLFHEMGEVDDACDCHELALEAFATVVDPRSEGLCQGRLAMALAAKGRVDEASFASKLARRLLGRTDDRVALGILDVFDAIVEGRVDEARVRASWLASVCDDVRTALRLAGAGSACLVVGPDARWLRLPDGSQQDLATRQPLRRLLTRLVEQHREAPGQGLTLDALRDAGWPGERVIRDAAANRVHVALTELRRRGLRAWLLRRGNSYLIDPSLRIQMSDR